MQLETAEKIIHQHNAQKNALIAMLQDVQNEFSYLPQDVLTYISRTMHVPLSRTYSLATFYRAFSLKPKGRHPVAVCLGTACHVRAAVKDPREVRTATRYQVRADHARSQFRSGGGPLPRMLRACPVVTVGPELYGKVSLHKVDQIIKQYSKEGARDAKT